MARDIPTEPEAVQKPKRVPPKAWKPGQSGNPAGTSKTPPEVRAFLREHSLIAAQVLVEVAQHGEEKNRVAAAKTLLDFSVSKPKEESDTNSATVVIEALAAALTGKT